MSHPLSRAPPDWRGLLLLPQASEQLGQQERAQEVGLPRAVTSNEPEGSFRGVSHPPGGPNPCPQSHHMLLSNPAM